MEAFEVEELSHRIETQESRRRGALTYFWSIHDIFMKVYLLTTSPFLLLAS